MANRVGLFDQWLRGNWADREAINRNADSLESIEANVTSLAETASRQQQEIVQLKAMVMGLVDVLQARGGIDEADLKEAVARSFKELSPPPVTSTGTPYRARLAEPTAEEIDLATQLLSIAQRHHYAKEFPQAREMYQRVIDRYGHTKQAATARQQLENLKRA